MDGHEQIRSVLCNVCRHGAAGLRTAVDTTFVQGPWHAGTVDADAESCNHRFATGVISDQTIQERTEKLFVRDSVSRPAGDCRRGPDMNRTRIKLHSVGEHSQGHELVINTSPVDRDCASFR